MLFFPIKDSIRSRSFPVILLCIISINVFAYFIFQYTTFVALSSAMKDIDIVELARIKALYETWGFVPAHPTIAGFAGSLFIHGGLFHLAGNMLFLWVFGKNLEGLLGRFKFLFLYMMSHFGAILIYTIFHIGSTVPIIGASGAISGIMGAYLILFPLSRIITLYWFYIRAGTFKIAAFIYLILWFGGQLFWAVMSEGGGITCVAYSAHIGGFVSGIILGKFLPLSPENLKYYKRAQIKNLWQE